MATIEEIEAKLTALKTAYNDLGEIKTYLKIKNEATPELRTIATACKNLPPAQKLAVLNTLAPESKKVVESLITIKDVPQDSYATMRTAYFELIDALEEFREQNGKFKRPFTRSKKASAEKEQKTE